MNKLPLEKRIQIINLLVEGSSMRSISRVCDVSINTVSKLLVDAGTACAAFHDANVRNVKASKVQCDEIWSFCYAKQANAPTTISKVPRGDIWTWTAIEGESKLIVTWHVGKRDGDAAYEFMCDLKDRLATRVQLTSDGFAAYRDAVGGAFGSEAVDYAMLVKLYGQSAEGRQRSAERRYSPAVCVGARKQEVFGEPDRKHVSTSYAERQNLTMRMHMRRFTRLTNAFSKKAENHCHMVALYTVWYNYVRQHKTHRLSPAMAAGICDKLWSMTDLANMVDATLPTPGPRGPYKKDPLAHVEIEENSN